MPPETTTVTVRVGKPIEVRLKHLARTLRRSRSSVAAEAIEVFLEAKQPFAAHPDQLTEAAHV